MRDLHARSQTLGVLWLIYAALCAIKAVWMVVESPVLTLMWGALLNRVPDPLAWMGYFHFMLWGAIALAIVSGILAFFAAASFFRAAAGARDLVMIASLVAVITGPLGLILGLYTLAVVLPRLRIETGRQTLPNAA